MISSCMLSHLSCVHLFDPVDCSPPGSSVYGMLQARILQWFAISFSRGSSQPRDKIHISYVSCTGRRVLYHSATWETQCHYIHLQYKLSKRWRFWKMCSGWENYSDHWFHFCSFYPEKGGELLTIYNDTPLDICMSTPFTNYKRVVI